MIWHALWVTRKLATASDTQIIHGVYNKSMHNMKKYLYHGISRAQTFLILSLLYECAIVLFTDIKMLNDFIQKSKEHVAREIELCVCMPMGVCACACVCVFE